MSGPDLSGAPAEVVALPKGRLTGDVRALFARAGLPAPPADFGRRLIVDGAQDEGAPPFRLRFMLAKPADVPTYVEYGGADIGVAGRDVLIEHGGAGLYQPLDLNIARCHMAVAAPQDFDYASAVRQGSRIRVATKYTTIARQFFADKGVHVDLIKLYGSMELAPLTGMADAIVDLVSTGATLKANQLVEVEHIMDISSRLVVNQAALKLKTAALRRIIDAFAAAVIPEAA